MNQKLLTFVVPCYNVEKYVQRCLDSIYACNLSEDQYEVICINDCSPDNVQSILERNRSIHSNLRIIVHKKNKKLGGARNTGIKEARGRYIWFVDSDDTINGSRLRALVQRVADGDVDVFCFNYRRVDIQGKELASPCVFDNCSPEEGRVFLEKVFGPDKIIYHMGYVVRFFYRTEFLRSHHLFFPENVYWEDTVFMPKALVEAERAASTSEVLYNYWMNADSITSTFYTCYPANLIFDYTFCAGADLLSFSEEVKDVTLRDIFRKTATKKYLNGFPIKLFRTSKSERKQFYALIKEMGYIVKPLRSEIHILGKLLLLPAIGPILTEAGSHIYRVTHKKKLRKIR